MYNSKITITETALSFERNPFPAKNQTLRSYRVYFRLLGRHHHQLLFK